ncbi:MAG: DUF3098 domain-containing protein [Bacteroidales bacterium]|nr:DUF3098 domain-containing protein [Bacteroidales bacterium]
MKSETKTNEIKFVLEKQNYILLLIGFVIIVIGFILMVGGGTDDPAVFSDKIFSFRRITLAPIVVLLGFAIEVYAIMKKPSKKTEKTETESKE